MPIWSLINGIGWRAPAALIAVIAIGAGIAWHVISEGAERRAEIAAAVIRGQNEERVKWIAAVDKERQRQAKANQEALQAAQDRIASLEAERDDLNQALEDLSDAADKVADANRACLDPGIMQRLDRIR